ncbi:MT-A70 family methyltransferase [Sinorhizobium meliloti]|uniref:MT-A70 family methyltransferase n=1 Tax=Rhizobium meliloti TaxID=382 RepID=UPI0002E3E3C4|nr:MT-A70 family methyltransferase [Sinorhizobium meliloti]MDE3764983.1 adenine methyltransferase [Sinorhizobium meliloti]MDE3778753.1 adenine methyltransferase [Sinorhizobium meliloti]MDE3802934.1 adenine methyltransferase [Sinorhizobium meliloti]WQP17439.1 MT-A70 family methyltransferase [Sinorhizobium meliloti]
MIVIDIPWRFDLYSDADAKKSASTHYDVMSAEQIRALPVGQLASMNCLIHSWATAPHLPFAVECLKAWGFEYKSFMAWRKTTAAGKVRMGTGYRVRAGEIVLVGTLGNPKQSPCSADHLRWHRSRAQPQARRVLCPL